jgi:hypothetical protein
MNRTKWLPDRRMQKFRDVLGRWENWGTSLRRCSRDSSGFRPAAPALPGRRCEEEGLAGLVAAASEDCRSIGASETT